MRKECCVFLSNSFLLGKYFFKKKITSTTTRTQNQTNTLLSCTYPVFLFECNFFQIKKMPEGGWFVTKCSLCRLASWTSAHTVVFNSTSSTFSLHPSFSDLSWLSLPAMGSASLMQDLPFIQTFTWNNVVKGMHLLCISPLQQLKTRLFQEMSDTQLESVAGLCEPHRLRSEFTSGLTE